VLDPAAVSRAVEGHDAVISVFGVRFDPFNAEDEIRNLRRELATQRQLVGDLLGNRLRPSRPCWPSGRP
jgi:hypothetical protein